MLMKYNFDFSTENINFISGWFVLTANPDAERKKYDKTPENEICRSLKVRQTLRINKICINLHYTYFHT